MTGPDFPFEYIGQAAHFDERPMAGRVHGLDTWIKDEVRASVGTQFQIAFAWSRVSVEVLVRSELGRVDEDADGDEAALGAGAFDQTDVSGVQGSHCRNKSDRLARSFRGGHRCAHVRHRFGDWQVASGGRVHGLHRSKSQTVSPQCQRGEQERGPT